MLEAVGELEGHGGHEGEGAVGIQTRPLRGHGTPYTRYDAVRYVASLNYSVDFRSHSV